MVYLLHYKIQWLRCLSRGLGRCQSQQIRLVHKENMTNTLAEKIYAAFDELSQRNTRPRRLIAETLIEYANTGTHFTTEDFWQQLRQLDPRIGRATVFRSIEKLVEMRLLDRV